MVVDPVNYRKQLHLYTKVDFLRKLKWEKKLAVFGIDKFNLKLTYWVADKVNEYPNNILYYKLSGNKYKNERLGLVNDTLD